MSRFTLDRWRHLVHVPLQNHDSCRCVCRVIMRDDYLSHACHNGHANFSRCRRIYSSVGRAMPRETKGPVAARRILGSPRFQNYFTKFRYVTGRTECITSALNLEMLWRFLFFFS